MKLKRELGAIEASDAIVDGPRTKRRKRGTVSPSLNEDIDMANGDEDENDDYQVDSNTGDDTVKEIGLKIWNTVRDAKGKDDRVLAHDFLRLPSKRQYADYYNLIKRPISLEEIKAQLVSHAYPTIEAVKQDFDTCFRNAKRYNMKDSQIWRDAKTLHKIVSTEFKALAGLEEDVDIIGSDDDGGVGSEEDEVKGKVAKARPGRPLSLNRLIKTRMQKLVDKTDDTGRVMTDDFMELPSRKLYPLYYKTIKKLMCFDMIFKKIKRKEYTSAAEFAADVELVFSNAFTFNEEHSPIWNDAASLKAYFKQLMSDLPAPHTLPAYGDATQLTAAQNGKIKLRVPAPSNATTSPATSNTSLTVKIPATANTSQPSATHSSRQPHATPKQTPASRSPKIAARPSAQTQAPHAQNAHASSFLHPATFPNLHPHHPQPRHQQHSTATSQTHSATHSISPSPLPLTPTPPITFDHPLRSLTLRTMPLGRTLRLDSSEGVRTWMLRLGKGETALEVRDVRFLEVEESEDDDDESQSAVESGRSRGEVIVKANGANVSAKVPNSKEGQGLWELSDLKNGNNVLEVGEKGGEIWKIVLQRIGVKQTT